MSRTLRLAVVLLSLFSATFILKASLPQVSTGAWQAAGSLATARSGAAAVALPDGRILITGGSDGSGAPMSSTELFNTDGTFSSAAAMKAARSGHAAIVLPDGRVLVAGGRTSGGGITNSAETYDPQTNAWQMLSATMVEARAGHSISQLLNGDVLLAGGESSAGPVSALEVFDETNDTFSSAGALVTARQDHAAAVLSDGRVLIAGGTAVDASGNPTTLSSTEIYDGGTGAITAGPALATARAKLSATTLLDGTVALIGGDDGGNDLASIEIYDPAAGTIAVSPASLATARSGQQAFLLPHNGSVLVVGGTSAGTELASAELFVPWNTAVQATGAMASPRAGAAGAPLSTVDGLLLVAGGQNAGSGTLAGAELYGFATVKTDQSDYAPGTTVNITGSGWQPGETVSLTLVESPNLDTHPAMTAVADQNGNISNSQFSPDSHDLNVRFYLTASGSQSQAQTTFTDAAGDTTSTTVSCSPSSLLADTSTTCTATVGNTQSGAPNGYPQGTVTFSYNGTVVFTPSGVCTLAQIGSSSNSSCAVTLMPTEAGSGLNVKGNFNSSDNNKWKNSVSSNFGLTVSNPIPSIANLSPASTTVGAASQTLTVNGTNFVSTSTVTYNGVGHAKTFVNSTQLTIVLSASDQATAGNYPVVVTNPVPGGGSSNPVNFVVNPATVSTATSVNSSANPSAFGQGVTFTATVTPSSGTAAPTGTVQFVVDGTNVGSPVTVTANGSNGTATSGSNAALVVGSHTVSASYSATGNFTNSSGSLSGGQTVNKTDSLSTITSSVNPSALGQSVTFTATVSAVAPGAGTATGTVTFNDGATTLGTGTLNGSGQATLSTGSLSVGPHPITAVYAGDRNFNGSTSSTLAQTVSKADTTAAITSDSPDPSVVGQAVTVSFTLTVNAPGSGTPTGNVTVSDGTVSCTGTVAAGTCSLTFTSAGAKSLTATYAGDSNFNGSTSAAESHTVDKANTTTTITSDTPDPSVVGQSVTVNYSVTVNAPGSGTPTGNVTVSDGTVSCTGTVAAGSCSLTFTSAGAKSLTATYAGDSNFNGSTSAAAQHTVNKAETTTTITSDNPDPSVVGQPVTVGYTVAVNAPGSGTPTGNVTVSDGTVSCTAPVAAGSCSLTFTSAGARSLTATYAGDSNFNGSTSAAESHTVDKANTTTTITSDTPDPSVVGQSVTVNYSVTVNAPGSGTPTGNVTVSDGTVSCTGTVAAGSCSLTFTSAGAKSLTATYAGDSNFNGSTSAAESHTVDKANTTTTITSDTPDPSVVGQSVTVNYSVTVNAPGSGTPTGNVTVSDGTVSCTGTVAAGTCSLTLTSAGVRSLTATYAGDTNFNGSTSAAAQHTVNKAETTTTITSDNPDPSVVGQPVTVGYTVAVNAPGSGTPTGNVTVSDGTVSCTAPVAAGSCSLTFTSAGARSLTATYAGDSNFNNSASAAVSHTVDKASTSTALSSSVNPSVFGQSVTFTASVNVLAPGAGTPTGTVTFMDGANTLAANVALNGLQATFTTSALSVGSHSISAVYSGDSNFNTSTGSLTGGEVVNKANTSTPMSSSANPSLLNQFVTFTATVSVTAPGSGTPTGSVTFMDGANTLAANVALNGLQATFTTSSLPVGSHSITAVYSGDGNFNGSTSAALSQLVQYEPAGTLCLGAPGHQILQPINADGSSVFKQGSTVPAKFRVCDVNGTSIGTAGVVSSFRLISIQNGTVVSTVDESVDSTTPDSSFRWDPTNMQWIFNMNTKSLSANKTYAYLITLNDGTMIGLQFGLK